MANIFLQSYLQDTTIPMEKRRNAIKALKAGQDPDDLAEVLKTKYTEHKKANPDSNVGARFGKTISAQSAFENVDISQPPAGVDINVWSTLDDNAKKSIAGNMARLDDNAKAKVMMAGSKAGKQIEGNKFANVLGKNLTRSVGGAVSGVVEGAANTAGNLADFVSSIPAKLNPMLDYAGKAQKAIAESKGGEAKSVGDYIKGGGQAVSGAIESGVNTVTPNADQGAFDWGKLVGQTGEQLAEFLVPASKITKLGEEANLAVKGSGLLENAPNAVKKVAPLAAQGAVEGVSYGGVSAAEEGGIDSNVIGIGIASGALPMLSPIAKKALDYISAGRNKAATNVITKLIKPNAKSYMFGKDPSRAVIEHLPISKDWESLVKNINKAKNEAGKEIENVIMSANPSETVSVRDLIAKNLDNFKAGNADSTVQKTYMQKMMDLVNETAPNLETGELDLIGKVDIDNLNAENLWKLQKKIGSLTKWTGQAGENEANKALHQLYSDIGKRLDQLAPGTKQAQFKYADLLGAQKSIEARAAVANRNTGILTSMIGGGIGAGLGDGDPKKMIENMLIGIALPRIYNSPAFRTTLAKILATEGIKNPAAVENISKALMKETETAGKEFISKETVPKGFKSVGKPGASAIGGSDILPQSLRKKIIDSASGEVRSSTGGARSPVRDVKKDLSLKGEDAKIQDASIQKYKTKRDELVDGYLKKYGDVINTDNSRPFFKDVGYEGYNAAAVHEASSALTKDVTDVILATSPKEGFAVYGGGSGVGKTSAVNQIIPDIEKSNIIYDGNASNFGKTIKIMEKAIDNGKIPSMTYVYRDMLESFKNGVVKRMISNIKEMGRIVPIKIHIKNHTGSLDTIKNFVKEFKGTPFEKKITVINNSLGKGNHRLMDFSELQGIEYKDIPRIKAEMTSYIEDLYKKGEINKNQYEAFIK